MPKRHGEKRRNGNLTRGAREGGPDQLPLRTHYGLIRLQNGFSVDVGTDLATGEPIIEVHETGRLWQISWFELLEQAIESGVCDPVFPQSIDNNLKEG